MNSSSDSDDEFFDAKESPLEEKPPFDIKRVPLVASRQNSPTKPIRHVLKSQVSADDSPFSRQRKLNYLREKMRSEFDGDVSENINSRAEISGLGYGGVTTDSLDSSNSELSSLASWSKHLLMSDNSKQSENIVVKPLDTVSTKAAVLPSAASDNNFPVKFPPPPTVAPTTAVHRQTVVVVTDGAQSKFSSSSTESSKNSTMERFETPESKSSSLERNMQISRSLSSKTGSLTREMNSIGACEQFLYDNDQLADLERKNSAAAEVVEALTSELVRNVKSERNLLQRSVESLLPVEESDLADGASVVAPKFVPPTESPVKKPHKEPDIITSNRVRAAELTLDLNGAPVKPPRRKNRLGSSDTASSSISSPLISPGVGITITDSDTTFTRPFDLHNEDDVLDRTIVKNLDTGEQMPLSVVDERLPKCDPLTLHIMRLTSDFPHKHSVDSLDSDTESFVSEDTRSVKSFESRDSYFSQAKQKTSQYKKLLGKTVVKAMSKTANKVRKAADGVSHHFHKEETSQSEDEENSDNNKTIRIRASHKHKGPYHFEQVKLAQDLTGEHSGAVWCLKFSHCGRLLATAGQDNQIRIWVLKDAFNYFNDMRSRYNAEEATVPFQEQLLKCAAGVALTKESRKCSLGLSSDNSDSSSVETAPSARASVNQDDVWAPFMPKPFCVYRGHSADVLDLSWSKNYFILSSSMDRTVRLWHISRTECLCCFQHIDFVTAIAFLPKDDRYFLSGSLDGKLRLWHIPEKKVALWNEVDGGKLVTTLTFARNGKFAVVGTYDGRCIVYSTEQLKYHTQIDVKSSHGKNSRPHKVTGLDSYQDKLLVTSNDSRIRLYDLRDLSLTCKYKGYTNYSSQIRASFNHNGKYIVCGSEDKNIYLWKTTMDSDTLSLPVRKDRNRMWESVRAHNAVVTAVVFAPRPELIFQQIEWAKKRLVADCASIRSSSSTGTNKNSPSKDSDTAYSGEVFVSADFTGAVHVFINKAKVKTGSSTFMPSY